MAVRLSRQRRQAIQMTSSAAKPVEKIAPARTARFVCPNSICPMLLIQ